MSKMYFYSKDEGDFCYDKEEIKSKIFEDLLTEKKVIIAERIPSDGTFWCSIYGMVMDTADNRCGKNCKEYSPRNGKSGYCRFSRNLYGMTDKEVTIKL